MPLLGVKEGIYFFAAHCVPRFEQNTRFASRRRREAMKGFLFKEGTLCAAKKYIPDFTPRSGILYNIGFSVVHS